MSGCELRFYAGCKLIDSAAFVAIACAYICLSTELRCVVAFFVPIGPNAVGPSAIGQNTQTYLLYLLYLLSCVRTLYCGMSHALCCAS